MGNYSIDCKKQNQKKYKLKMSTRYNLPLSSLPEEFFVEELHYRDKKN